MTHSSQSKSQKHLSPTLMLILLPVAGILQTLSLAPFNIWPAGLLSAILLLQCLWTLPDHRGGFYGWLFGMGLFGSGASWVYVSIHTYGYTSVPLAVFLTLLFVSLLSLFPALFFKIFTRYKPQSATASMLFFSAIFVLGDVFRGWFLTGFPWLYIGYSNINTPLSGWAPILGVHGLTLFTLITGGTIWLALDNTQRSKLSVHILILLTLLIWVSGFYLEKKEWSQPITTEPLTVAAVQANIPQKEKWNPGQVTKTIRTYVNMTKKLWNNQIIIWPETAIPALKRQIEPFLKKLSQKAKSNDTALLTGIPTSTYDKNHQLRIYNSIIGLGLAKGVYNKQKLVPFGEYIPLESWLRGLIRFFDLPMSDFTKGSKNQPLLTVRGFKVSPYICYELVYPDFVAKRAHLAAFLVTISDDSWFGHSLGPLQHLQMAQMRALENARYLVRATNNGISAIINPHGAILKQSPQFQKAVMTGKIYPLKGRTLFSYWGSMPVIIFSLLFLFFRLIRRPS